MWRTLVRVLKAPMRAVDLLTQILALQREQNALLREMHVGLTGRPALTIKPSMLPAGKPRVRTGTDVWTRPPQTAEELAERHRIARENAASAASSSSGDGVVAPEAQKPTPIDSEPFDGIDVTPGSTTP